MSDPGPGVDERLARTEHGVVAVLVLGGFVFQVWYVVPVVAILQFLRAAAGGGYDWLAPGRARLAQFGGRATEPRRRFDDPRIVRTDAMLVALTLTLATLAFAAGVDVLGWIVALVAAGAAAVRATTGASPARLLARLRDR